MNVSSKNLVGTALIALAAFSFWAYGVASYRDISKYRKAITGQEKVLQERREILNAFENVKTEYQNNKTKVNQFSFITPAKKDIPDLIAMIDAIGIQSGVRLSDINISENKGATSSPAALSVSFSVVGSYDGLKLLLSNLERNIRIIDIQTLSMQPDKGNANLLNISINAVAYFLK